MNTPAHMHRRDCKAAWVLAGVLLLACILPSPASAGDAEVELRHGIYAYEHADYNEAITAISSVLNPLKLTSEEDIVSARKYLGASYFFAGRKAEASEEFRKLLLFKPDFRMDAFMFPPPLVLFFDEIRAGLEERLEKAKPKQDSKGDIVRETTKIIDRRIEEHYFALNFIPFGVPQFQNGDKIKGWTLLGLEAALLALNIFAYWQSRSYAGSDGYYRTESDRDSARTWMIIQMTSLSLLGAAVIYGVADGIAYYKPFVETVTVKKE